MIRPSLCNYSDTYVIVKWTKTVANTGSAKAPNNRSKNVKFKICAPSTDCISYVNNKEIDHAKNIDEVILINNLIEYSSNYLKTSEVYDSNIEMDHL